MRATYIPRCGIAEIEYEDHEFKMADKVIDMMYEIGWDIQHDCLNHGQCRVEDRDEFREFMDDWKECKKLAK